MNHSSSSSHLIKNLSNSVLVEQVRLGCDEAFEELWNRHNGQVRRTAMRIVRCPEDAEDIVQEAFLLSYIHIAAFNGDAEYSTWLSRIAVNASLMLLRKRRRRPEASINLDQSSDLLFIDFPDRAENPEKILLGNEVAWRLTAAAQRLPSSLRSVMDLHMRQEHSLRDIALQTGMTVSGVKSRLFRARTKLRSSVRLKSRTRNPVRILT